MHGRMSNTNFNQTSPDEEDRAEIRGYFKKVIFRFSLYLKNEKGYENSAAGMFNITKHYVSFKSVENETPCTRKR